MENISGRSRAGFRWMLSFATIGLVVSISPCFAQGDASQKLQPSPEITTPFKCDSLDPKVCFEVYQRRLEQRPEGTRYNEYPLGKNLAGHRFDSPFDPPKAFGDPIESWLKDWKEGTRIK
jgi:hypothetical protein